MERGMAISWLSEREEDLPAEGSWLSPREAERAARMRFAKRRNDFLLARWTAKRALARSLGLSEAPRDLAEIEIRNAADGAPEAFAGPNRAPRAISMTDRAGWAVCAVGPSGLALGCDLELVEPRSDAFVADYLTPAEQRAVEAGGDVDLLANLFWCAKESALKALRTGLRRDTRSVEVSLGEPAGADGWRPLEIRSQEGTTFPGWWRRYDAFLLTIAASLATPPPTSMVEPPGLEDAVPTHSWLAEPAIPTGGAPLRQRGSRLSR